jgi:hypothetical protein
MSKKHLKLLGIFAIQIAYFSLCHAFDRDNTTAPTDLEIISIIKELKSSPPKPIADKLYTITNHWLNRPYKMYCLGEGPLGDYDQRPLYRTDQFDCETFVDMSLAVAHAQDIDSFYKHIIAVRYQNQTINFTHRNHFTNIDWNQSNQKQHYIKDITDQIVWNKHPIFIENNIVIKKGKWYKLMSAERVYLPHATEQIKKSKLNSLKENGKTQGETISKLKYIPISAFFDKKEHARASIFKQIPHGAIIEIVTPDFNTEKLIGTNLDISHLGFAFYKNKQLYFRNASMIHNKIYDELLSDYLKKYLHSTKIKGIHIEMPLE